ncbi:unnamed protein product [Colias eurytheme]|nr:unnamed protein product [Colias eurytheme]
MPGPVADSNSMVVRERCSTRADVNKPRSGASTALTISGILGSGADVVAVTRVVKSGGVVTGQHKHSHTGWFRAGIRFIKLSKHDTSRPTLRSRPAPVQFTSPHPAPDWQYAARASDDLALQRAPPRAAAPFRAAPPPRRPYRPPRVCPTSGESQHRHR